MGRIFFPSVDTEKEPVFSQPLSLRLTRRKHTVFFARNENYFTQKFHKAVKKCLRRNLANILTTYLHQMCLICRSEICAELCLALSVFTITHNGNRAASGKMAATSITPLAPRMHLKFCGNSERYQKSSFFLSRFTTNM